METGKTKIKAHSEKTMPQSQKTPKFYHHVPQCSITLTLSFSKMDKSCLFSSEISRNLARISKNEGCQLGFDSRTTALIFNVRGDNKGEIDLQIKDFIF